MQPTIWRGSLLFLTLLVPLFALAQSETTPAPPQFGEEIEVRVIDVDVVVTDRQGNPLMNLTREDFELYEDGKRVEVPYFSRIVDGRIADLPQTEEAATPATLPRTPLTWVIFLDQTSLPPQRRNQAMRQLQTFMQRTIVGGERGVIAMNDGRSFKIRQGLTDDSKLLMNTLATIGKERVIVGASVNRANIVRGEISRADNTDREFEYMAQNIARDIDFIIQEEANRTRNAILAMGALLDTLARVEGRLALLYVGAGFNTLPAMSLTETWKGRFRMYVNETWAPDPDQHKDHLEREITRLYANLSALRVTVYTIHGGETAGSVTNVEDAGTIEPSAIGTSDRGELAEAGLAREMAQRTGGLYFKVNQNLSSQLEAVRRDLSNYYSLGYKPTGSPSDSRRVKVKVNVQGARVRHRETVRERTRQERAAGAVVAAAIAPRPAAAKRAEPRGPAVPAAEITLANPLGVQVEAGRPRPDGFGRDHLLPFNFSIQLEALTFFKRANAHRSDFTMHFALVGKDGSVYPLESRNQTLAIPDKEMPAKQDAVVSVTWHVDLAPLRIPEDVPVKQDGMRLTVTVEDRASGTRSVVTVPLRERG